MPNLQTKPKVKYESKAEAIGLEAQLAFRKLRTISHTKRNSSLWKMAEILQETTSIDRILEGNQKDIQFSKEQNLRSSLIERLFLDANRIKSMGTSLQEIANLADPVGEIIMGYSLSNGIELVQKRVPLGVIFTIYESRPNVTVDTGALCIKSGNCAILRGGKEAFHTNLALFKLFLRAMKETGLPDGCLQFVQETDHSFMTELLKQERWIDLVVPRGGENLIHYVNENTRIPVVKHDKGVCSLYIDPSADFQQALSITFNSKMNRSSVCNSLENLIIHKDFAARNQLLSELNSQGIHLIGNELLGNPSTSIEILPPKELEKEYFKEYLDQRLSVKFVDCIDEALDFIFTFSSGHSDGIVARDTKAIHYFQENVDTAAIFVNCSTRFHDGGQMGLGAEVGISTGRLHVRGPMALKDLTTTTYILTGSGQIRS